MASLAEPVAACGDTQSIATRRGYRIIIVITIVGEQSGENPTLQCVVTPAEQIGRENPKRDRRLKFRAPGAKNRRHEEA